MLTKERKFIVLPPKKRGNRGLSFFELARKHLIKGKGARMNRNLSSEIDKIAYGV